MNKSKKNNKILNKSKKYNKKLNKTIKNKSNLTKCKRFCKKDYMPEINKVYMKTFKKFNIPYKTRTKEENDFTYHTCQKTFCNEKCNGYDFSGNKQKQIDFKKTIKNGFSDSYSKDKVKKFKNKGALSGCIDILDYDVYHK